MEFSDTFEIADTTREEAWLALSDPVMIKEALPGCQFLVRVDDEDVDFDELREQVSDDDPPTLPEADTEEIAERAFEEGAHYAALMEIGVGSVKPSFETVVTITEREFGHMSAEGEGEASNSSFELEAGMQLEETENGVAVDWQAQTDVFGRVAQMGQRVINPVANRVVNRFFGNIEDQLRDVETDDSSGITDKIRDML
ncbi:carbon monoxide dehydrogenase [Haladaptatus sp. R4]|uniref:CoxG family protein n=1 Tax=Haladaptatus sp. R4 TaxID=1679489 RepID=UPI0007B4E4FD|nr:SRPBCC domain-containing protein [Haladaptatus sp. R4]KZN24823.1 carbon monoxide dehydrogenase [Haladaptatus sp. R4]